MTSDFIHQLGPALTAHRLKRTAVALADGFEPLFQDMGINVPGGGGSTLLLLDEAGPLGVVEISKRLRLSHPHIVRTTAKLVETGQATFGTDERDARKSIVSLTSSGRDAANRLKILNIHVARAYQALFDEIGTDLIALADRLEEALARESIADRVRSLISEEQ
jgi:DNA-binding MarR family transcriptional regulator